MTNLPTRLRTADTFGYRVLWQAEEQRCRFGEPLPNPVELPRQRDDGGIDADRRGECPVATLRREVGGTVRLLMRGVEAARR